MGRQGLINGSGIFWVYLLDLKKKLKTNKYLHSRDFEILSWNTSPIPRNEK